MAEAADKPEDAPPNNTFAVTTFQLGKGAGGDGRVTLRFAAGTFDDKNKPQIGFDKSTTIDLNLLGFTGGEADREKTEKLVGDLRAEVVAGVPPSLADQFKTNGDVAVSAVDPNERKGGIAFIRNPEGVIDVGSVTPQMNALSKKFDRNFKSSIITPLGDGAGVFPTPEPPK
jgi:hypothetical protein